MGTMIGNILALVFIVIAALVGIISLEASAIAFVAISYFIWLLVLSMNFVTKPPNDAPLCQILSPAENKAYRRYHLHLWGPGASQIYSALMNALRMAGFVWGGICLWNGLYWLGGASIVYFFVTGSLILKTNPWLYMAAQAKNGNQVAIEQLSLIENVQEKMEAFHADSDT